MKAVTLKTQKDGDIEISIGNQRCGLCRLVKSTFSLDDEYTFASYLDIIRSNSTPNDIPTIVYNIKMNIQNFLDRII